MEEIYLLKPTNIAQQCNENDACIYPKTICNAWRWTTNE